jgi:hypothetical protein
MGIRKEIVDKNSSIPIGMTKAVEDGNIEEYFDNIPQVAKQFMKVQLDTETDKKIKEWLDGKQ